MPFERIVATNLSEEAAEQIRKLIVTDVLRPGDQLPGERELADRMGISRTSIRSALKVLQSEGLLLTRQGAGLRVADDIGASIVDPLLSLLKTAPGAVNDYLRFRGTIESACVAEVANSGSADEIDEIARLQGEMELAVSTGNLLTASRYDAEFHMAIVEATGNVVTVQVMRSLEVLLQSGIRQSHKIGYENPESLEQLVVQHQRILSAIRSGNSKKASAAMSDHLEAQAHNFEQQLKAAVRRKVTEQRRDWSKSKRD